MVEDCINNIPIAVTIADNEGNIVYMNTKSKDVFSGSGGEKLIGSNLFGCHNENSQKIISSLLAESSVNCYTIEKRGIKKLIWQGSWLNQEGETSGVAEISIVLPENMPHFNRDKE